VELMRALGPGEIFIQVAGNIGAAQGGVTPMGSNPPPLELSPLLSAVVPMTRCGVLQVPRDLRLRPRLQERA
jgi:hypothetical protein